MPIKIVYRAYYDGDPLKEHDSSSPGQTWAKLAGVTGSTVEVMKANHYSVRRVKIGEEETIAKAALDVAEVVGGPKVGLIRKLGKLFGL